MKEGIKLLLKRRVIGSLVLLVLALALIPAVASAVPLATQGVAGVVRDSVTGVGVPFATVHIDYFGDGHIVYLTTGYDGTYSYSLAPGKYFMEAWSMGHSTQSIADSITVDPGAVTTQDFTLVRYAQPVYRFFNMVSGVHFYTASDSECAAVCKNLGKYFKLDGIAWTIPLNSSTNNKPLYRFFNVKMGVHFYTKDEAEKAYVLAHYPARYHYEGVAYMVSEDPTGIPVYRFYNPARNAHFYTVDMTEVTRFAKLSTAYHYEGVAYYIGGSFAD